MSTSESIIIYQLFFKVLVNGLPSVKFPLAQTSFTPLTSSRSPVIGQDSRLICVHAL